jgi:uncharacterized protein (TIGR03435 family)
MRLPATLAMLALALPMAAQSFDAASIKSADPEHIGLQIFSPNPGGFRAMAADVKHPIAFAYSVGDVQISGGPRWSDSDLFDIEAKAAGPAATDKLRVMARALLADRFHLKVHRESKEQSVFDLVVGKKGPKLTPVETEGRGIGLRKTQLNGRGATMSGLASILSSCGWPSSDRQDGSHGILQFHSDLDARRSHWTESGPSIFNALEEQLGLKLEPAKGPVEMLVIDAVERPSAN